MMRPLNLDRTFTEEEATERCPLLVTRTARMATMLSGWGWGTIEITYKYGKPGTGSAHAWLTAERGSHGLTLEYLYRLNTRTVPSIKFIGGFWDGGPFRTESDLTELAKPLRSAYNQQGKSTQGEGTTMATTATPRKRAAKNRPTTDEAPTPTPPRKRAAKKVAAAPVETEETPARKRRGRGPWENQEDLRNEVVELRENKGLGWAEIAEKVGVTSGMATFLWYCNEYGDEFHGSATPDVVSEERDVNGLSWSQIEAKYWITRGQAWDLYAEAGGDHMQSDIGKGGRYIVRDPEVVAARQAEKAAARKAANPGTGRKGRKPKFKGFTEETPEEDIVNMIDGRKITWTSARGGELSATVKPDSIGDFKTDSRGRRSFPFNDGSKSRTIFVNAITAVS